MFGITMIISLFKLSKNASNNKMDIGMPQVTKRSIDHEQLIGQMNVRL